MVVKYLIVVLCAAAAAATIWDD